MRSLIAGLLICGWAVALHAQDWAKPRLENSPRHLEWAKVNYDNRTVNCFVAYPESKNKSTVVIVIHEIFGLSDWVRSMTDQLAEEGYIAIAPDLLSGMGTGGGGTKDIPNDKLREHISNLKPDQITADLNACVEFARKLDACNGKVVVCGFCWGGKQTFRFANNAKHKVDAFFPFYGDGPTTADGVANAKGPIHGFFAGNDARVNSTLDKASELYKSKNVTFEYVTYEEGGHGFMRAGEDPTPARDDKRKAAQEGNKKARAEAWKRWLELLKKV